VGGTLGLAGGLLLAVAVLYLGPRDQVICGSATGPSSVAEEAFQGMGSGHVDGPSSNTCPVPGTVSWVLAVLAVPGGVASGLVLSRPRHVAA